MNAPTSPIAAQPRGWTLIEVYRHDDDSAAELLHVDLIDGGSPSADDMLARFWPRRALTDGAAR